MAIAENMRDYAMCGRRFDDDRMHAHTWLHVISLICASACAGAPPSIGQRRPAAAPADVRAQPRRTPIAAANVAPADEEHVSTAKVARELANAWCEAGFGFPTSPPGEEPIALPPCSAAHFRLSHSRHDGELESALIALGVDSPFAAEERHVYLRSGDAVATVRVADAWSSGVGAFSHEITIDRIRVDDVFGDAVPEWWAEIELESHDTDADECKTLGRLERRLVLCTLREEQFACLELGLAKLDFEEIYADASPDLRCKPARHTGSGFALDARVSRGSIELTAQPKSQLAHPLTRAEKPPFSGKWSIEQLLARTPAKVVVPSHP